MTLEVGENSTTDKLELDDVTCTIIAGLGPPEAGRYRDRSAGWYVFCNGRTVVAADKTGLTGWTGGVGLPLFQPKHRPFLGTVYFTSVFANKLPWDTTKSRINEDSELWQQAKRIMVVVGKSVTSFLDSRYTDEGTDIATPEISIAARGSVDAMSASVAPRQSFQRPSSPRRQTTKIQYEAQIEDVKRIATYLSRPAMSGSEVGRHTFGFFLRNEVGED